MGAGLHLCRLCSWQCSSPLTLVVLGGIGSLPKYDVVAGRLKA